MTHALDLEASIGPSLDQQILHCKRLWATVFHLAVEDARADVRAERKTSATLWFYRKDRSPGSFLWLCELFGFDSERIVAQLFSA